jgi:hypothetical protein
MNGRHSFFMVVFPALHYTTPIREVGSGLTATPVFLINIPKTSCGEVEK